MKRLGVFEWSKHAALLALGQDWMTDSHLADLFSVCELAMVIGKDDPDIYPRAASAKAMLIEGSADYDTLRTALGGLVSWIGQQPNRAIHDAAIDRIRAIDEHSRQ